MINTHESTNLQPILVSNHRHIHDEATAVGQGWHQDGDALLGPELHNLQVFYYPQDVTDTMGPTAVFPSEPQPQPFFLAPPLRDLLTPLFCCYYCVQWQPAHARRHDGWENRWLSQ
eukprot:COSAG05_NODE_452_length_9699_cov_33.848125_9_plen_116_part_00